ncbi:uncharacterized protein [Penaeus vannamei]|uniref:uncharacterized protein n=1 Tax=Penaeus vannamei TaxID=6689 RepID=UPI00387F8E83
MRAPCLPLLILATAAVVESTFPLGRRRCSPSVIHKTNYETEIKKVPVYKTVTKKQVVEETFYTTELRTKSETEYVPKYYTRYVTETQYQVQPEDITHYKIEEKTQYQTQVATKTERAARYVTKTEYQPQYVTQTQYQPQYQTQYAPSYVTTTQVAYYTQYEAQVVPRYHTVIETKVSYVTQCPNYGYDY